MLVGSRNHGVLYAARYRTRCPGCRTLLFEGLPIFKSAAGWGCYQCYLAAGRRQQREQQDEMVRELLDDVELIVRKPERCNQPARKLSPGR